MLFWKILGGIGRTLISSGVIILLFVAYQLWGTGVIEAQAQEALGNEFDDLLAQVEEFEHEAESEEATVVAAEPQLVEASADDAAAEATPVPLAKVSIPPEFLYRGDGEVIGRILIEAINVDKQIVEGTGVEPLRLGPGRYPTSVFPGQAGNASIAGHRTTYGAPFHRIDELVPGDIITVQTIQGVHKYEVNAHEAPNGEKLGYFIVDPSATEVLGDFGDNRLTLTACHPKYSAAKRIIVTATLITEPVEFIAPPDGSAPDKIELQGDENSTVEDGSELATEPVADPESNSAEATGDAPADDLEVAAVSFGTETTPLPEQIISDEVAIDDDPSVTLDENGNVVEVETAADDFGEGLNGDRSAILPSITWGIAAGAIWLAAWFVGTKWRRWPMYAVGLLPFAAAIWMAFVHVDQALPSY